MINKSKKLPLKNVLKYCRSYIIRCPQENTNTEALTTYNWKHGDLQRYKHSPPTPISPQERPKNKTADILKSHYK